METIIKHGGNVNATDHISNTALHLAVLNSNYDNFKLIIYCLHDTIIIAILFYFILFTTFDI